MFEIDFDFISNTTHLVPFSTYYKIEQFDCGIEEYNQFLLNQADEFQEYAITNTQLLIDNKTGDIVGYISLCMSSIKLTSEEKLECRLKDVNFSSIPALKLGKLAIDEKYKSQFKGYGSYLVQIARGIATELNQNGIACRFIAVDADLQYYENTSDFYIKNDFVPNEAIKHKPTHNTLSMRLDLFAEICEVVTQAS